MATKPTPAQLAARKTFADMARSGGFKKKRKVAAKKAVPKRKANPFADMDLPQQTSRTWQPNPATRMTAQSLGLRIAGLVTEGYQFAQAEAIAVNDLPRKPNAATVKAAVKHAREVLNFPDPLRVTKKGVVRRNPVGSNSPTTSHQWKMRGVKKNPSAPAHKPATLYVVWKLDAQGEPHYDIAKFRDKSLAVEYAKAYATAHKVPVGITGKAL